MSTSGMDQGVVENVFGQSYAARLEMIIWLASYSLLVYDYTCTLDKEVKYVWSCPWTSGLVLFYLNRYLPFIDIILFSQFAFNPSITVAACCVIIPLSVWLTAIGVIISQMIIFLRTYAIWGRRRMIFWILAPTAAINFSFLLAFIAWKTFEPALGNFAVPTTSKQVPCRVSGGADNKLHSVGLLIAFLLNLVAEVVITILTAIKAREHVQKASSTWVTRLYGNGFIYCACLLAITATNSVMSFVAPPSLKVAFLPLQRTLHSVFCNRVIFLILQHRDQMSEDTDTWQPQRRSTSYTDSAMDIFTTIQLDDTYDDEPVADEMGLSKV
ncbi:hypothetical protein GALMADRAFT_734536 [Galerina marginata CBS 339.88]|uniref:DUF6533 domain-containing protein n=1 Tax=Galerina marginata (strain CBS 339.88) TaxID=685588 RepID=A0A067SPD4_GALM3|nr:hypothetical protein GALMADRAFT_734536 [Galerina marginata CBS 339.88]